MAGFLRTLAATSAPAPVVTETSGAMSLWEAIGLKTSGSLPTVNQETAMGVTSVYRAVSLIAGTIASLPLHAYKATEDGRERQKSGNAADLLAAPHPDLTPYELIETVVTHLLLWGNAYLWVGRDGLGVAKELWPLHPAGVKVGRLPSGRKIFEIDGEPYSDQAILHIPLLSLDGVVGLSPIAAAKAGIGMTLAAEDFGGKFFASGTLSAGILTSEQRLNEEQATTLQKRWKAKHGGLAGAAEVIVLDSGSKYQQLSIPPADAQFLESRKFQVQEIARLFGIPPHLLADVEGSTSWGTGIEQQSLGFVRFTLRPILTRIEQRLSRVTAPGPVYVRFAVEALLRGDSAGRAAFYKGLFDVGAISPNEIRALEEMAAFEGGDEHYIPLNYGAVNDAAMAVEPQEITA